jgi:hypothetical protein
VVSGSINEETYEGGEDRTSTSFDNFNGSSLQVAVEGLKDYASRQSFGRGSLGTTRILGILRADKIVSG